MRAAATAAALVQRSVLLCKNSGGCSKESVCLLNSPRAYDAGMHGLGWFVPQFLIACKWIACKCRIVLGALHVQQEPQTVVGI